MSTCKTATSISSSRNGTVLMAEPTQSHVIISNTCTTPIPSPISLYKCWKKTRWEDREKSSNNNKGIFQQKDFSTNDIKILKVAASGSSWWRKVRERKEKEQQQRRSAGVAMEKEEKQQRQYKVIGPGIVEEEGGLRVFRSGEMFKTNIVKTAIALLIWVGAFHLNMAIYIYAIFFLPFSKSILVFALLLVLILIPVDPESKMGKRLCRYICENVGGYFPVTLHVEDFHAFQPDRAYVFGFEPHSVLPLGIGTLTEHAGFMPLPKVKVLVSDAIFYVPFLRHIWTWFCVTPATKKNFISLLKAGYSCILVPGGVQEVLRMERDVEVAFLSIRKGFIKVAMETGTPLVPVFCFGQSKLYKFWRPSGELFLKLCRAVKFTPMIFGGAYGSLFPNQHPMDVVVGRPIEVKENPRPTLEELNEVHEQFIAALKDLFERHKARIGYPDLELKII